MTTPPPGQVCINPSQDPKTLKQCTQSTKQENDTCCFGEIVNVPICKTCAPNQMLYNGKCTDTTDLGCCFKQASTLEKHERLMQEINKGTMINDSQMSAIIDGYYCNMKTGINCTLTTKDECPSSNKSKWPTWAALGSNADLGFATPTCSLDLSFNSPTGDPLRLPKNTD